MYQYQDQNDTIAAIATPPGIGGIGIIRLSGAAAIASVDAVFKSKNGRTLAQMPSHRVVYGWVCKSQDTGHKSQENLEIIDEVL